MYTQEQIQKPGRRVLRRSGSAAVQHPSFAVNSKLKIVQIIQKMKRKIDNKWKLYEIT